uniref:Uncharacterized protein n=1 Tax=Lepeophtheirus salmonis TaxID=72036 RepID=A0A0K2USI7_LEPSM
MVTREIKPFISGSILGFLYDYFDNGVFRVNLKKTLG